MPLIVPIRLDIASTVLPRFLLIFRAHQMLERQDIASIFSIGHKTHFGAQTDSLWYCCSIPANPN